MASEALIEAVAVTAELCGRVFSAPAARMFVADLEGFSEPMLIAALRRCRREVRGALTVQDVVSRIDDGRPGPDEAFAMIPQDEAGSVLWTAEMATAWGAASHAENVVSQRLAFREAYSKAVSEARSDGRPVSWMPSLGHDPRGRQAVIEDAVARGRLSYEQATNILPMLPAPDADLMLIAGAVVRRIGSAS